MNKIVDIYLKASAPIMETKKFNLILKRSPHKRVTICCSNMDIVETAKTMMNNRYISKINLIYE